MALSLLADRWSVWLLLAVHETDGARFADLADEPGLSRRVLAERLRQLVSIGLLETRQYSVRPPRNRYHLSARGLQVRRLLLATVHVVAGGALHDDPLARGGARPRATPARAREEHPADSLLAGDLDAARRIYDETVAVLARYDSQYRSNLLLTLDTWLACDASVSVAAARLYAHRHTVRYRLGRIAELAGLDPSSIADRERLVLGLRARRVLLDADALDAE